MPPKVKGNLFNFIFNFFLTILLIYFSLKKQFPTYLLIIKRMNGGNIENFRNKKYKQ